MSEGPKREKIIRKINSAKSLDYVKAYATRNQVKPNWGLSAKIDYAI